MNKNNGSQVSKYRNRTGKPIFDAPVCSPHYAPDCFRLVEKIPLQNKGKDHDQPRFRQGDILADAKYILCDNATGLQKEMVGVVLFSYFSHLVKGAPFIPWVLARCTIIPL